MSATDATNEQLQATAHIDAAPDAVFAFLCDPANHQHTEPTDWVRDAITTEPITAKGQMFGVHMYLEQVGGPYDMHNVVTQFEPGRTIAWWPALSRCSTSPVNSQLTVWSPVCGCGGTSIPPLLATSSGP